MKGRCRAVAPALALLASLAGGCRGDRYGGGYVVQTGGDAARGRVLIHDRGCVACHTVPGVAGAYGVVGPPLTAFAHRGYVAGVLPNRPENLVRWIEDPPAVDPLTAMPKLGLDEQEARDIAAYLYTLR